MTRQQRLRKIARLFTARERAVLADIVGDWTSKDNAPLCGLFSALYAEMPPTQPLNKETVIDYWNRMRKRYRYELTENGPVSVLTTAERVAGVFTE